MLPATLEDLARGLLTGKCSGATDWDLGRVVEWLLARGGQSEGELGAALKCLNDRRAFRTSVELGRSAIETHPRSASLRRLYIQALIDSGALEDSGQALTAARQLVDVPILERLELEGLEGRRWKQLYVEGVERRGEHDAVVLEKAIDSYLTTYESNPQRPIWHGINAVALLIRSAQDGIPHSRAAEAPAMAQEMVAKIEQRFEQRGITDPWDAATAAEAFLAYGDANAVDRAEVWLYRYVLHPDIRTFHLGSTYRQLREVWGLQPTGGRWGRLLTILEQRLASEGVARLEVSDLTRAVDDSNQDALEKVFGKERFIGYDVLKGIIDNCAAIGRVENRGATGVGTGFLVRGRELSPTLPDAPVFVTNAHVLSDTVAGALATKDALVRFEVEVRRDPKAPPHAVKRLLRTSPPGEVGVPGSALDFTIVELEDVADTVPCLQLTHQCPRLTSTARAYVIGHPDGNALQFSLHDSELLDIDDSATLVHYKTPTIGGSSGSPVFDRDWRVFALHHGGAADVPRLRGDGTYPANEGIALGAIAAALAT